MLELVSELGHFQLHPHCHPASSLHPLHYLPAGSGMGTASSDGDLHGDKAAESYIYPPLFPTPHPSCSVKTAAVWTQLPDAQLQCSSPPHPPEEQGLGEVVAAWAQFPAVWSQSECRDGPFHWYAATLPMLDQSWVVLAHSLKRLLGTDLVVQQAACMHVRVYLFYV